MYLNDASLRMTDEAIRRGTARIMALRAARTSAHIRATARSLGLSLEPNISPDLKIAFAEAAHEAPWSPGQLNLGTDTDEVAVDMLKAKSGSNVIVTYSLSNGAYRLHLGRSGKMTTVPINDVSVLRDGGTMLLRSDVGRLDIPAPKKSAGVPMWNRDVLRPLRPAWSIQESLHAPDLSTPESTLQSMIGAARADDLEQFLACFHPHGPKYVRFKKAGTFKLMMNFLKTDDYRLEKLKEQFVLGDEAEFVTVRGYHSIHNGDDRPERYITFAGHPGNWQVADFYWFFGL